MFDTMTLTKAVGAFCAALLVFLLGGWVADGLYHTGGGHGEDGHQQAYVIEVEGAETEVAEAAPEVPFAELYAVATAEAGERLWRPCAACHKLEAGANATGPYLHAIVGRSKHSAEGYNYSSAMANMPGEWTPENLSAFLENPSDYVPGTKMVYRGMAKPEDRANLIAYLATFGS